MDLLQQIQDFLSPKLESICKEQSATRERLNTIDMHLVDQSRRIDALGQRIDETNRRIDKIHADLLGRIEETNRCIDKVNGDLTARIGSIQIDTIGRFDKIQADFIACIDETHRRLDRLYEVIVRRDEHEGLGSWGREWAREVDAVWVP